MSQNANTGLARRAFLTGHWQSKTEISSRCLNNHGVYCLTCKDSCEEGAIIFNQLQKGMQLPVIISERCTHCKECVKSCPVDAISISDMEES